MYIKEMLARAMHPFIRKLSLFLDLTEGEQEAVEGWCANPRPMGDNEHYIRDGDVPETVCLMHSGWAYRYKELPDGKRQIVGFLLPGDMCDPQAFILSHSDHNVAMLSAAMVSSVHRQTILADIERYPRLSRGLWWLSLVDEGIARAWIANLGQRDAAHCVAHLFCELWTRAKVVGLVSDGSFELEITQVELADAVGVTPIHISRTLSILRSLGLLRMSYKSVQIDDVERLAAYAGFDPSYLQLRRRG